jgi:NAD(P)-dependent dehydrogenase (short-subunit alcohol dehydrogenase family)
MKVVVIGATGTIGAEVADALEASHEVVRASRSGEPRVDLADPASVAELLAAVDDVDAIACCAASAPQDGGSITLTSGQIPEATPGSAGGALVNAGLEAFVSAAAVEMPRRLRLNAVSPGWVRESLAKLGMDESGGIPAGVVARAYLEAVEGTAQGRTIIPGS